VCILLSIVAFGGIVATSMAQRERSRARVRWAIAMLLYGVAPIVAVFAHAHVSQSYFVEKVFVASTLAMPILGALCVVGRARWVAVVALVMLVAGAATSDCGYFRWEQKEDWRDAVAYVNSFPREGTLVVFVANEGELLYDYYTGRQGAVRHAVTGAPQSFFELEPPRTIQRVGQWTDTDRLAGTLGRVHPERVLLVSSHWMYSDPKQLTQARLAEQMQLVGKRDFVWVEVEEFVRK
jgi:hypothetical protein